MQMPLPTVMHMLPAESPCCPGRSPTTQTTTQERFGDKNAHHHHHDANIMWSPMDVAANTQQFAIQGPWVGPL